MAHLRRKLEDDPTHPRQLLTEPGMGYRFRPERSGVGRPGVMAINVPWQLRFTTTRDVDRVVHSPGEIRRGVPPNPPIPPPGG